MNFPPIQIPGTGSLYARLITTEGTIVVQLHEQLVPKTVANFVGLATGTIPWRDPKSGQNMQNVPMYDGVRFHRVIPSFMIQCGDPLSRHTDPQATARWGTGDPGYKFDDEFSPELRHAGPGVLSMANSGPGTNGSQWFITEVATPHLDGKHSVFGQVVAGSEIVPKIARVPCQGSRPAQDVVLQKVEIFRSETKPTA
jgi:peptidyl-prolyl cis-trans isomerase A (cyclophilin A)